jgi:pyridoxine 5'-phosphate synthase PdxJ
MNFGSVRLQGDIMSRDSALQKLKETVGPDFVKSIRELSLFSDSRNLNLNLNAAFRDGQDTVELHASDWGNTLNLTDSFELNAGKEANVEKFNKFVEDINIGIMSSPVR